MSCFDVFRNRLDKEIADLVRRRPTDRCAAEPLMYMRYARERLAAGDFDSAFGSYGSARKFEERCRVVAALPFAPSRR